MNCVPVTDSQKNPNKNATELEKKYFLFNYSIKKTPSLMSSLYTTN